MRFKSFLGLVLFCSLFASGYCSNAESLTDADWAKMLAASARLQNSFLVYTWSPNMNGSQRGLGEVLTLAVEHSFRVEIFLDPFADEELAQKVAKAHGWPSNVLRRLEAKDLLNRGLRVHYPSYLFVKDGKVRGSVWPGYKFPNRVKAFVLGKQSST